MYRQSGKTSAALTPVLGRAIDSGDADIVEWDVVERLRNTMVDVAPAIYRVFSTSSFTGLSTARLATKRKILTGLCCRIH
eukprot:SAG11_NODE_1464_length_4862_cov_1.419064_5_plen_80_part_00